MKETELIAVNARDYQIIDRHLNVSAIVRATDESLMIGEFPAGQIIQCGGPELLEACVKLNGCKVGEAKITKGYGSGSFDYVIHTVDPRYVENAGNRKDLLASCYRACLRIAIENNIRSIAFPSISTVYKDNYDNNPIPLKEAVEVAVPTVKSFTMEHVGEIDVIKWVLYDDVTFSAYMHEISLF